MKIICQPSGLKVQIAVRGRNAPQPQCQALGYWRNLDRADRSGAPWQIQAQCTQADPGTPITLAVPETYVRTFQFGSDITLLHLKFAEQLGDI